MTDHEIAPVESTIFILFLFLILLFSIYNSFTKRVLIRFTNRVRFVKWVLTWSLYDSQTVPVWRSGPDMLSDVSVWSLYNSQKTPKVLHTVPSPSSSGVSESILAVHQEHINKIPNIRFKKMDWTRKKIDFRIDRLPLCRVMTPCHDLLQGSRRSTCTTTWQPYIPHHTYLCLVTILTYVL